MRARRFCVVAALSSIACSGAPPAPAQRTATARPSCNYDVSLSDENFRLAVIAECSGFSVRDFVPTDAALAPRLRVYDHVPGRSVAYEIDLEAVASAFQDADVALRSGDSILAPASTWLLRPEPERDDVQVNVTVHGGRFTTGLSRNGDRYQLFAHEIRVATYSVFGDFASSEIELDGHAGPSTLELVTLDAPLALPAPLLGDWIKRSAAAVAGFYVGFPVRRALVVVSPIRGRRGVVYGQLLPESSPAIVLMIGERTTAEDLARDWILIHELFHLGFPSFIGEGKWLDEGLATYFEPLIRARAGWLDETRLWQELAVGFERGARALARTGAEQISRAPDMYWAGALVCFLADVQARRGSNGKKTLDAALRGLLATGANASEVRSLRDTVDVIDRALGEPILRELEERHRKPVRVDVRALLGELGVRYERGTLRLSDDAPLSWVRRRMISR